MKRLIVLAAGLAVLAFGGDARAGWDLRLTSLTVRTKADWEANQPSKVYRQGDDLVVYCAYMIVNVGSTGDWTPWDIKISYGPDISSYELKEGGPATAGLKTEHPVYSKWTLHPEKFPPGNYAVTCRINNGGKLKEDDYQNNTKSVTITVIPAGKMAEGDPAAGAVSGGAAVPKIPATAKYSPRLPGKPKQVTAGPLVFVGATNPVKGPKPDLEILRAGAVLKTSCSPADPVVDVHVKVVNRGSAAFPALPGNHVVLVKSELVGSPLNGGASIPQLAPGQTADATVPVRPHSPPAGLAGRTEMLKIHLNSVPWVEESDFSNNKKLLQVAFPADYCKPKPDALKPPPSLPPQRGPGPATRPLPPAPLPTRIPPAR